MKPEIDLETLMLNCSGGDETAFEQLYNYTSPKLYTLLLRILKKRSTAEDILQEVFVTIWNRAKDYHPAKGSVMSWISTIARNRAIGEIRKVNPLQNALGSDDFERVRDPMASVGPLEDAIKQSEAKHMQDCLEELNTQHKQSIFLAFFYGQTHEEIGHYLDTPLGTVKSWIRRGMNQLRKCLER